MEKFIFYEKSIAPNELKCNDCTEERQIPENCFIRPTFWNHWRWIVRKTEERSRARSRYGSVGNVSSVEIFFFSLWLWSLFVIKCKAQLGYSGWLDDRWSNENFFLDFNTLGLADTTKDIKCFMNIWWKTGAKRGLCFTKRVSVVEKWGEMDI